MRIIIVYSIIETIHTVGYCDNCDNYSTDYEDEEEIREKYYEVREVSEQINLENLQQFIVDNMATYMKCNQYSAIFAKKINDSYTPCSFHGCQYNTKDIDFSELEKVKNLQKIIDYSEKDFDIKLQRMNNSNEIYLNERKKNFFDNEVNIKSSQKIYEQENEQYEIARDILHNAKENYRREISSLQSVENNKQQTKLIKLIKTLNY